MAGRLGEKTVTGSDRRLDGLRQGDVHRVIRGDVVPQRPRTVQKIEVGVTMEIEVGQIGDRASSARPKESSPVRTRRRRP
jgi:hypothetical protein